MHPFIKNALGISLIIMVCLASLCFAGWYQLELEARQEIAVHGKELSAINADLQRAIQIIGGTANEIRQIARDNKNSTDQIAAQSVETSRQINGLLARTDSVLRNVDSGVSIAKSGIVAMQSDVSATLQIVREELQTSQQTLAQATATLKSSQDTISNKDFAQSLERLNGIMLHLEKTAADGQDVADYYKKTLTTPQGFWKATLGFILNTGSKTRILIGK